MQADAAPIYDNLFNHPRQLILEVGCWMHGRRNFFEDRATDRPRAELVLARIGQLYDIERDLKACCADEWRDLPREALEDRIADVRQEPGWSIDYEDDQAVVFSRVLSPSAGP